MADLNSFSQIFNSKYPALGYRFKVTFNGIAGNKSYPFQSVSMLSVSNKSTLIIDGGDNAKEYKLPTKHTYKDVKLVRGLMTNNTDLMRWFDNLGLDESGRIKTAIVVIELLDTNNLNQLTTIEKWSLYDCFPTSFTLGEFNSQKNAVVLETITLAYSKYERESVGGQLNYY
jgi:phage tail-like protein